MKALIFEQTGPAAEVLNLEERPSPAPGPGEVLLNISAASVNPADLMFVQGFYGIQPELPSAAGFEGVGTVAACGPGVEIPVGSRLLFTGIGAWAEQIVVPAKSTFPAPAHFSDEVAAQAFINPLTARLMLHESGLQAGDSLLLTAGGSSFSQLCIALAKKQGIRVFAAVRRPDLTEHLKNLGAEAVINTSEEKLPKRIAELTGGKGVNYCFEAVGGKTGEEALKSLKFGGKMFVYGLMSLQNPQSESGLMIFKNLTVSGFWLSSRLPALNPALKKQLFTEVYSILGTPELMPVIEAVFPLKDFKEALARSEKAGKMGKVLFVNK